MDVPTDPRWDQLPHLFAGELSDAEARPLQNWIDGDPARQEMVARLREAWQLAGLPQGRWNVEAGLAAIHERTTAEQGHVIAHVGGPSIELPRRRFSSLAVAVRVAAVLATVAGGAAVWHATLRTPHRLSTQHPALSTYTTQPAQRMSLRLQDGTLVTLAPGSTLRQPSTYGRADRVLFLEGEAHFVVTHDTRRPFRVHAGDLLAEDLGTEFVVRSYAEDEHATVAVREGVVKIMGAGRPAGSGRGAGSSGTVGGTGVGFRQSSAMLERGDRGYISADGTPIVGRADLATAFAWTEGRLVFRDTPLAAAAQQLGRWHDIKVHIADARTGARRLTATFDNEPIADVIHRIATSLDLEVGRTDRTFTLRAR